MYIYRQQALLQNTPATSVLGWNILEQLHYPHFPDIDNHKVATANRSAVMNLQPYIDTAAFTIHESATFQRTYKMVRTLGLRQLIVVNKFHQVLGIVTRVDVVNSNQIHKSKDVDDTSVRVAHSSVKFGKWFNNNSL